MNCHLHRGTRIVGQQPIHCVPQTLLSERELDPCIKLQPLWRAAAYAIQFLRKRRFGPIGRRDGGQKIPDRRP